MPNISSLPHDQHVPVLNTIPFYVRQFYVGLCTSPERVQPALTVTEDTLMCASCISEVAVKGLQYLMSSELSFKSQCLSSFDIHRIFQAVLYLGLQCKLKFDHCHFGLPTFEVMARWLRAYSILPSGGAVQELRCVCFLCVCVCVCVFLCVCVCVCACIAASIMPNKKNA